LRFDLSNHENENIVGYRKGVLVFAFL
jgi:hypothetical protein